MIDDVDLFAYLRQSPKIFIYLTTKCVLNCKHCYLGHRLQRDKRFCSSDVLNILDLFSELDGEKDVTFLGGEPVLYPEINKILQCAKGNSYYVRLDTSGFYSKKTLDLINLKSVDQISFSLDGSSAEIHDAIRIPGSFNRVIDNIYVAKEKGCKVRITMTVMKQNLSDVVKVAKLIRNLGVSLLNLHLLLHLFSFYVLHFLPRFFICSLWSFYYNC